MKTVVAIQKAPRKATVMEVRAAIEACLDNLGGLKGLSGATVLLKPNAGVAAPPESARNTDPRVVEGLVSILKDLGAGKILVGEASVVGTDTMEAFAASGILEAAQRAGAEVVDLKAGPFRRLEMRGGRILDSVRVAEIALEVDLLISLPKLKTIAAVPVSLSYKNLKGLLPDVEKKRFHHTDLNKAIFDLNSVIRPDLVIIDGLIASEIYEPREADLLIAGRDALAVDTVGCLVMGMEPKEVQYLAMACEAGLGVGDIDHIEIRGRRIEEVREKFRTAPDTGEAFGHLFPEVRIVDGNACSGCAATVYLSLKRAGESGLLSRMKGMTLAMGKDARPGTDDSKTVYLGNCLKDFEEKRYVPGCPFIFMDFIDLVEEMLEERGH